MGFIHHLASAAQQYAWTILWAGAILTALEIAFPHGKCTLRTRIRALLFWMVYILITVAGIQAFAAVWGSLNFPRWYTIRIGDWFQSEYAVVRAAGYLAPAIIAATIVDFFYYWFHRLQHASPMLWKFHRVHHSIAELSAWNSNHHFTEELLRIPFMVIPISLLIGVDAGPTPWIVATLLAMKGLYNHSCTRLHLGLVRYVIADNRYHRIHHSIEERHRDRNFAGFSPLWDLVFRTAHFPSSKEWPRTGVVDFPEPTTLREFLLAVRNAHSGQTK